jgi:hypothetical protein
MFLAPRVKPCRALKSYGIVNDDVMLYHVDHPGVAGGFTLRPDYGKLADSLERSRAERLEGNADPVDFDPSKEEGGPDWDPTWHGGESWRTHPAEPVAESESDVFTPRHLPKASGGVATDLWDSLPGSYRLPSRASHPGRRSESLDLIVPPSPGPIIKRTSLQPPPRTAPTRSLGHEYVCRVGPHTFRLLHLLEGRWNGESEVMAMGTHMSPSLATRVCATSLRFDDATGSWVEAQSFTTSDGLTTRQQIRLTPIGDGLCRVTLLEHEGGSSHPHHSGSADPKEEVEMRLQEISDNLLLLTGVHRKSGRPVFVETTTVVDELRRARTIQRFALSGALEAVFAIREARVIDAVSGAVTLSTKPSKVVAAAASAAAKRRSG